MKLRQAAAIKGKPTLPGDKSISHRAAMISSLATGTTRIVNYSRSADCLSTLKCFADLGVNILIEDSEVVVRGVGLSGLRPAAGELDCGNSGTTMRLLAGVLASQEFDSVLTGDESLLRRPMERIAAPLREMGASVITASGKPPLNIRGHHPLGAINFHLPIASAQIKSAILLAALNGSGASVIEISPTRDHTERMLELFGITVEREIRGEVSISVSAGQPVSPGVIKVPADISAAAFFLVAAACIPGSDITLESVGLNPSRSAIIDVIRSCGIDIQIQNERIESNEPTASLRVRYDPSPGHSAPNNRLAGAFIPNLIDELPILAVLGTQLPAGLEVRDAAELRHKESDRISSVVENLRRMRADVVEFDDGFLVKPSQLVGAKVDSFGDHRIAMAFAIAALLANGETEIVDAESSEVSFPGFFQTLQSVVRYR